MNTFWLKIMGLAILAVAVIIAVSVFTSGTDSAPSAPKKPEKDFYAQAEEDRERFLSKPQEQAPQGQTATSEQRSRSDNDTAGEPGEPDSEPAEPAQPEVLYFKELGEMEKIEAERLLNAAVPGRSIGRLPMTGFKLMVDSCREIIRRWPDSWYAYRAKQLLADLPERYQQRYRVTEEEKDLSRFAEQRPGTKPFRTKEGTR
jgi:hypothetical protein